MPLRIKTSKFRHIFGQPTRKDGCFENIRVTKNAHDSNFCSVNLKFLAVVLESVGGGAFLVLPIKQVGRVDVNAPKVCGHRAAITDIKWNPFDDHVIASASDDMTIKIWEIPELGLHSDMTNCVVELRGHGRRVTYIDWHPTAENVLLSCAFDYRCIIWDVGQGQPLNVISCHTNTIYSISWNHNGSLFATSSKDKKIRVINPRSGQVLEEGAGHTGLKACKLIFLKNNRLFTTGFSRSGDREIALWNSEDLSAPLYMETVDYSSGVLLPYYDCDVNLVYIAGKGDGNIRYFEIGNDEVVYLSQYPSSDPQRGLGQMPKRGLDVSKCEIARFYKLHTNKQLIEPLPMIVPRRTEEFAEDIYPPTLAANPALTSNEWISGIDREPVKVSVKPKRPRPKNDLLAIIVYFKLRLLEQGKSLELAERGNDTEPSRVGSLRAYTRTLNRTQVVKPVQKDPEAKPPPKNAPASLQNIYKLCTDTSKVSLDAKEAPAAKTPSQSPDHEPSPPAGNLIPSEVRQQQHQQYTQSKSHQLRRQQPTTAKEPLVPAEKGTTQPVLQAHVRPSPKQNTDRRHSGRSGQPHQLQQIHALPAATSHQHGTHHSADTHQQVTRQGDVHQHSFSQQLKWRNNLAWQKPATPVGTLQDKLVSAQPTVMGRYSSHVRQPQGGDQVFVYTASDGVITSVPSTVAPSLVPHHLHSLAPLSLEVPSHHSRSRSCPAPDTSSAVTDIPSQEHPAASHVTQEKVEDVTNDVQVKMPVHFVSAPVSSVEHTEHDTARGMSEVERKKRNKRMKQQIKRSASASKVESVKPPSPGPTEVMRAPSPPPALHVEPTRSDPSEEQRRALIAKKVAELRRIRDLARAYAQGDPRMSLAQGQSPDTQVPAKRSHRCPPVEEIIQPTTRSPRVAPLIPAADDVLDTRTPCTTDWQTPAPSLPTFVDANRSMNEMMRASSASHYDNSSFSELDSPSMRGELYENQRDSPRAKTGGMSSSKVSAPIAPQVKSVQPANGGQTHTTASSTLANDELHKAYFKQCEEIKQLRQQNQAKDKKIEMLEKELGQMKKLVIGL